MRDSGIAPDLFFFHHRGGRHGGDGAFGALLAAYAPQDDALADDFWSDAAPPSLVIDEVERVWSAIAERDDWSELHAMVGQIRRMGSALGVPPVTTGHNSAANGGQDAEN
jgi:hypothetical protein